MEQAQESEHLHPDQTLRPDASQLSTGKRLLVLLINYLQFVQVIVLAGTLYWPWSGWPWRIATAVAGLYLLPPLAARLVLAWRRPASERMAVGSRDFFVWWLLFNLQALFNRFPALEEMLRLVPALYSAWLRLWGARLGKLIYWAPGTLILDRSFLDIGDLVLFGAGVRLNPHVIVRSEQGGMELILSPIRIGDQATIGGYALLTAGTSIAAGEVTRAMLLSPPFSRWKDGRRERG